MGAKFAPCMRTDKKLVRVLQEERRNESETGCCVKSDGSGCIQTSQSECSVSPVHRGLSRVVGFMNSQKFNGMFNFTILMACSGQGKMFAKAFYQYLGFIVISDFFLQRNQTGEENSLISLQDFTILVCGVGQVSLYCFVTVSQMICKIDFYHNGFMKSGPWKIFYSSGIETPFLSKLLKKDKFQATGF